MTATIFAFPSVKSGHVVRLNPAGEPCRVLTLPVLHIQRERPSLFGPTMKSRRQRAAQQERLRQAIAAFDTAAWWS
jgi:hypothetical protein